MICNAAGQLSATGRPCGCRWLVLCGPCALQHSCYGSNWTALVASKARHPHSQTSLPPGLAAASGLTHLHLYGTSLSLTITWEQLHQLLPNWPLLHVSDVLLLSLPTISGGSVQNAAALAISKLKYATLSPLLMPHHADGCGMHRSPA